MTSRKEIEKIGSTNRSTMMNKRLLPPLNNNDSKHDLQEQCMAKNQSEL